jgi:hypothetical protein
MLNVYNNKKGFAFIGLLLSLVIIAGLAFGSFYFSNKKTGEQNELRGANDIETLNKAKKKINEINQDFINKSQVVKEELENASSTVVGNEIIKKVSR